MDSRRESSTKLMQKMMELAELGPITPAMKRLQERYLAGGMDGQEFLFACNTEVQKLGRERDER